MRFNWVHGTRKVWTPIRTECTYKNNTTLDNWCKGHKSNGEYYHLHPNGVGGYPKGPTTMDWYFEKEEDALLFALIV